MYYSFTSAGEKKKETVARDMSWNPSHHKVLQDTTCIYSQDDPLPLKPRWYFTKEQIEEHSPSRRDGIDCEYESHLRQSYCIYLQKLGEALKVPQLTIATAMMLCHRFYMHQSHAKNHWQTVANSCMFLACKAEETSRWLKDLIVVSYKLMYSWDPLAPEKIRQKEVYEKQKQLILIGEQLILVTVAFDLNIEHPYKPLVAALKRLGISQKEVAQAAWNYVNDSLRTTLCLQYKPHYIAAGSVFLAAKRHKIKLPSAKGKAWWMQFDVSPKQLEEVVQHMHRLLDQRNEQATPASGETTSGLEPVAENRKSGSSKLCISKPALVKCNEKQPNCDPVQTKGSCLSDSGSADSAVDDGDADLVTGDSNHKTGCQIVSVKESCQKIDIARIRERLNRRKSDRVEKAKLEAEILTDEAWIEREIEKGIEIVTI